MQLHRVLALLGAASGIVAGGIYLNHNQAQAVAAAAVISLPPQTTPDALLLVIEGPLTALDPDARTLEVNGNHVVMPPGMLVDTNRDGVGDITLQQLADPSLRSPIGGTVIVDASAAVAPGTNYAVFTATGVYFEFGERVVVGPLISLDTATGLFQVAGHQCRMSTDSRLNPRVLDAGGNPMALSALAGYEGSSVSVTGYLDAGQFYAVEVLTDVVAGQNNLPGLGVIKALYNSSNGQVDLVGTVSWTGITHQLPNTVTLDFGCDSLGLITVNVTPGAVPSIGDWKYRSARGAFPTNPGSLCVTSAQYGGLTQRTMDIK